MAETTSVADMREHLVSKAATDAEFRARLLSDPNTAVKDELGLAVPDGFTIAVHEEASDAAHLVLPPSAELVEEELQQAAGGITNSLSFWDNL